MPNKCKLRAGSVRVEVRLKKQDLGQWSDYCGKNDSKVSSMHFGIIQRRLEAIEALLMIFSLYYWQLIFWLLMH